MAGLNTDPIPTPLQKHSSLERLREISTDQEADGFANQDQTAVALESLGELDQITSIAPFQFKLFYKEQVDAQAKAF